MFLRQPLFLFMKPSRNSALTFEHTSHSKRHSAANLDGRLLKVLGAIFCLYAILMTMPWQPDGFSFDLDESYKVALNYAFATNAQFGPDFTYTYGPYGILQQVKFFPETYRAILMGRLFIGLATGLGLWTIFTACWKKHKASVLFLAPFLFFFPNSGLSLDTFYTLITVLPLLIFFYVEEHRKRWLSFTLLFLVVVISLVSLIKQTFFTLSVGVMLAITIEQIRQKRQPPIYLFVYLASVLGFWLLAGQDIQNIGTYLANASEVVKGFSATMGLTGSSKDIWLYLIGACSFTAVVMLATWRDRRKSELLSVAILALVFFLAFKSAFVRHDSGHVFQSVMTSIPIACLYSALLGPELIEIAWRPLRRTLPLVLVAWVLLVINAQHVFSTYAQAPYSSYYVEATQNTFKSFQSARLFFSGELELPELYQSSLARIKAANPLPKLSGTTDLYPNELAVVLAHGLPYQPRPAIQSFMAYTGELARINAAHLRSENAPENILFDIRPIDGRLPASEDGLSWPELLTRYDILDTTGSFLLLKRASAPRRYALTPVTTQMAALQDWIDVPNESDAAIWAEVEAGPSLFGKLRTTLFKLPSLFMEVELANGGVERYRVFPELMEAGQLVSPLVSNRTDFAYLASPIWQDALATSSVRRLRLVTETQHALVYPRRYKIRFSRFKFPTQDFTEVTGWQRLSGLAKLKGAQVINSDNRRLEGRNGPMGEPVLLAHADTKIVMDFPTDVETLSLGYGILDGAWQESAASNQSAEERSGSADGVMFRAVALSTEGSQEVLFSKWLDPHKTKSDRGEKLADIDLSGVAADELVLETLSGPAQNSQWDWAYWSRFELKSKSELEPASTRVGEEET